MPPGSLLIPTSTFALTSPATVKVNSDVINLTAENFEAYITVEPLMLIEFSTPKCSHCQVALPYLGEVATTLKERNIKVAKVDCDKEAELCWSNYVQSYPMLKMYKSGTPTYYRGLRKAGRIISYMIKQSLPVVSKVTPTNHVDFIKIDEIVVIAYLPSSDSESAHIFNTVAENRHDNYVFGLLVDPANAEATNVSPPAIVVYRTFDEPRTEFPNPVSGFSVEEISDWLTELSIPAIHRVDDEAYPLAISVERLAQSIDRISFDSPFDFEEKGCPGGE